MSETRTRVEDLELVTRVRAGDQHAFQLLVDRYSARVYTLVSSSMRDKTEVEDVVQDVFFKVYRKLDGFAGKSSFFTWLYRVALNTATDHLKKKRHDRVQSVEDFSHLDLEAEGDRPEAGLSHVEMRSRMADAIAELPDKYRDILVLREYEGCSYDEIADILGCSKGTVESRLFRARARLRDKLKTYLS